MIFTPGRRKISGFTPVFVRAVRRRLELDPQAAMDGEGLPRRDHIRVRQIGGGRIAMAAEAALRCPSY